MPIVFNRRMKGEMESFECYLPTSAENFAGWFEKRTQETAGTQEYPAGHGIIRLLPARSGPPPFNYLGLTVDGMSEKSGTRHVVPNLIQVTMQLVGTGERTVVRGTCHELAVSSYFVQIFSDIFTEWAHTDPEIYYHQQPKKEHVLGQLRLKTNLQAFESELKEFAGAYQDEYVRAVMVWERRDHLLKPRQAIDRRRQPIDWHKQRSWDIRLQLRMRRGPWQGIHEIALDVEASRVSGQYPVQLAITLTDFRYKEVEPFVSAFLARCREVWRAAPEIPRVPETPTEVPLQLIARGDQAAPEAPSVFQAPAAPSEPPMAKSVSAEDNPTTQDIPPWEQIPDHEWDRQALKLWWEGLTCGKIGKIVCVEEKTVRNRKCALLKKHGTEIVPTDKQLREKGIKVRTSGH